MPTFLFWCLSFIVCWPLALLRAVLLLPARMLGYRDADERRGR